LFKEGIYKAERGFNLTGSEIQAEHRKYYKTLVGANIQELLQNKIGGSNIRIISGNVLSGKKIEKHSFLGFYDHQVSVIPEGNYYELFGWITPGFRKFSTSRTFFSWLNPQKKYSLDTHLHGGQRAFIMSGEYEKVLPMDIYPLHLIKAIMIQDIDLMEKLGIYEVAPEDFALCEFICTSKVNLQEIIQNGIDLMIKEME
jgi:Na+-transporting NADH:ubiquinone oxidoreductase subunit A